MLSAQSHGRWHILQWQQSSGMTLNFNTNPGGSPQFHRTVLLATMGNNWDLELKTGLKYYLEIARDGSDNKL